MGIGGGLGAIYILWEMQKHGYPSLVLGFRNKLNYSVQYLENLSKRTGASTKVFESSGKKKAMEQLETTLASGHPPIAWMDLGGKPYYMHFNLLGVAVVYGLDDQHALVDKRAIKAFKIIREHLVEARAKVPSFKNRLMIVEPGNNFNIEKAILEGITDCIDYLGSTSTSFALPALRKWARFMTNTSNAKGWPNVFKGGRGLYGSLRTIYEAIEQTGSGGGGLRGMYANFLNEAAEVIGNPGLVESSEQYQQLKDMWSQLAESALPDEIEIFKETKELLIQRENRILLQGSNSLDEISPINDRLHEIKGELNDHFPLNEKDTMQLFSNLQTQISELFETERLALESLKNAISK